MKQNVPGGQFFFSILASYLQYKVTLIATLFTIIKCVTLIQTCLSKLFSCQFAKEAGMKNQLYLANDRYLAKAD